MVAPEPDARAATQSTSPRQPDGLLWAGPPEEDLYQEWMNLPDQFFDDLERTAHTYTRVHRNPQNESYLVMCAAHAHEDGELNSHHVRTELETSAGTISRRGIELQC